MSLPSSDDAAASVALRGGAAGTPKCGEFVLSLDFELLWGVRDHADRNTYGANVLGGRAAIPRMLELFHEHGVAATWATVGFLFCESREELLDIIPPPELRPAYANSALSSYAYFDEVGPDEHSDPYYFGLSLIRQIAATPRQEIGTHTLSHYYCLEAGQTLASFEADLLAAINVAQRRGITLRSMVFPRNQYTSEHIAACRRHGVVAYRGNPPGWAYRAAPGVEQSRPRRALRLLDAHTGVLGSHSYSIDRSSKADVPASQFLRPNAGQLGRLHPLHLRTVLAGMRAAAQRGRGYHLWWHPHNFGANTDANLDGLRLILEHFRRLAGEYGMTSRSMCDAAEGRA